MHDLEGKVALVTGAGRGLGRASCLALAEVGADIIAAARSTAQLDDLGGEIRQMGRRFVAITTDVTSSSSVDDLVREGIDVMSRLDVVVNNAGVSIDSPLLETTDEQWDSVISTNLRGVFYVMRAAGVHMVEQRSGKIINIASHWAFKGIPNFGSYCASKAAIVNLTRVAAVEWARYGVQVNALAPGYFATEFNVEAREDDALHSRILKGIPMRRMGLPAELGTWVVVLASSASDFMTGEVIVLDGGESAR